MGKGGFKSWLTQARIYQASQSAILVSSAENSWNLLLLSNLSKLSNILKPRINLTLPVI